MAIERQLILDIGSREVTVGSPVTVRVRDTNHRPIEGALVRNERTERRTDGRGRCELTFQAPGFGKIGATKSPTDRETFVPTTELVRVVPEQLPAARLERICGRPRIR